MSSLVASKLSSATTSTSRHFEHSTSSTLVERQQLLGNRSDTSTSAPTPNFDLISEFFSVPNAEQYGRLILENRQHHKNHSMSAFCEGPVNNNYYQCETQYYKPSCIQQTKTCRDRVGYIARILIWLCCSYYLSCYRLFIVDLKCLDLLQKIIVVLYGFQVAQPHFLSKPPGLVCGG